MASHNFSQGFKILNPYIWHASHSEITFCDSPSQNQCKLRLAFMRRGGNPENGASYLSGFSLIQAGMEITRFVFDTAKIYAPNFASFPACANARLIKC